MLRITVTAKDSPITVQDPRPVTQNNAEQGVFHVEPNTSKDMDLSWAQVERVAAQLNALAALDLCTFVIDGTGGPSFAEQPDSADNPVIDYGSDGIITAVSQALVLTGNNLLAGQVSAFASILADTVAGSVLVESVNPGAQDNIYDVEVIDSGGGGLDIGIATVEGREVITINLGGAAGEDCDSIAALINNTGNVAYGLVHATVVGVGGTAITTAKALVPFTGGIGTGLSITLAGIACIIVSIDISADPVHVITLATPALGGLSLSTSAPLRLQLRANGKTADLTLQHA